LDSSLRSAAGALGRRNRDGPGAENGSVF